MSRDVRVRVSGFVCAALGLLPRAAPAQGLIGGSVELGMVSGQPGQTVDVPVYVGESFPIRAAHIVFTYDNARLKYLSYSVDGSEAQDIDRLSIYFNTKPIGGGLCGFAPYRIEKQEFRVPAGPRRHIGFLRFYLLATAAVGEVPVAPARLIAGVGAGTHISVDESSAGGESFVSLYPETLTGGSVTITAPTGPRPVGDLSCSQFLDRVQLGFKLSEAYDSIDVTEDGLLKATLPGDATSWEGAQPGVNAHHYEVTARRDGSSSIPASCDLVTVTPAAPPVQGLLCGEAGLTWTNPVRFDQVIIVRDGTQIAALPGSAQAFADPDRPDALTIYTVITELESFLSPETSCIANGIWVIEAGDVQVPVGTRRVALPIFVTTSGIVEGVDSFLDIDTGRFRIVRDLEAALEGTENRAEPEFFLMGISGAVPGAPAFGMIWDFHAPREPEKNLPPGLHQHVVNFIFDVEGETSDGDVFPVGFRGGSFSVRPGDSAVTQPVDFYLPGEIRFGSGGVAPVDGLQAAVSPGGGAGGGAGEAGARDVQLSWRNVGAYSAVRIERNGAVVAELGGNSTRFIDAQLSGGIYTYKVSGVADAKRSFPRSTLVSTFSPPGAFLRGDSSHDGKVDISDPISTLGFLFLGGAPPACLDGADADDDGKLTISDAVLTLGVLFSGVGVIRAPGIRYPWFDPTLDELGCAGGT